jgi:excisionase family DNA binding protein
MLPEPEATRLTYTVAEGARLIGISRNSLYEALRLGHVPGAIRIGRRLLVSKAVLDSWLANPEATGGVRGPSQIRAMQSRTG